MLVSLFSRLYRGSEIIIIYNYSSLQLTVYNSYALLVTMALTNYGLVNYNAQRAVEVSVSGAKFLQQKSETKTRVTNGLEQLLKLKRTRG